MEKLQNQILSEIDDFLEGDLSRRENVECVILCGSYATGKATERSDVDLCYIGQFADFSRESLNHAGREYQLMIAPWSWYEHVISEYERKGNIGTITVMLATGVCLRGDTEKWRDLHQWALHYYDIGPNPPSDDEIRKIKVRISDLWDDLYDEAGSHKPVMCEIIDGVAIACQRHTLQVVLIRPGADLMSRDEIAERNSSGRVKLVAVCANRRMRSTRKDQMSWRTWQYASLAHRASTYR